MRTSLCLFKIQCFNNADRGNPNIMLVIMITTYECKKLTFIKCKLKNKLNFRKIKYMCANLSHSLSELPPK